MTYEQIIQKAGKRIVPRVYYYENSKEISLARDDFKQAKFKYNASLVGTVMESVELELKTTLPNKEIYIEITAKYGSETQKKVYGGYLRRNEPVYNADTKTYTYELYDKIITTMVDYKPIIISYPTTVFNFFKQLLKELNFTTDISSLPNGSRVIEKDIYSGINYTYRDVLNDIGQATATLFVIEENKIKKCSFGTSTATITDDILKNQNITLGKHFGPINTIVLTRSGNSDSIYYPKTLPSNPIEFRIADNQLMNENDREDYLADIYNQLKGIEFDVYDTALVGYGGFAPLSKIKISTNGKEYNSYVFNNEITISQGYEEVIYTEMPEESATDYKASDTTDRRINQVYIIARKLEKEIVAVVDTTNKIAKEVNPIKAVSGSNIYLDDASNNELMSLQIEGKSWQEVRSGKNLLNNIANSKSNHYGVNYVVNNDKSILVNGTASSQQSFNLINYTENIYGGKYLVGAPKGSSTSTYCLIVSYYDADRNWKKEEYDIGNGLLLNSNYPIIVIGILVRKDAVVNNQLFKPMIVDSLETEYEQYGVSPSPDYPSKIESVGYENLFDINSITENYLYEDGGIFTPATTYNTSDYISCKSNEFIVSAKFTAYNPYIRYIIAEFDENKTYIQRQLNTDSSSPKYTFTLNDNTKYIRLCYRNDATLYDIQLGKGSIAHPYISYGKYGVEVKTVGKNKFDEEMAKKSSNYTTNTNIGSSWRTITIDLLPETEYTITRFADNVSTNGGFNLQFYLYEDTKNPLFYVNNAIAETVMNRKTVTFKTRESGKIYLAHLYGTDERLSDLFNNIDIQIEEGKVSTKLEEFSNNKCLLVLNEPLRSLPNGVKDIAYIRNNKLYVDRKIGNLQITKDRIVSLTNSLTYSKEARVDKSAIDNIKTSDRCVFMSNTFEFRTTGTWGIDEIGIFAHAGTSAEQLAFRIPIDEDVTFFDTNPTYINYELETPVTEEYDEIEILETLKGFNHIFVVDKLEPIMNIEYVRDTVISDYVENHISTIKIAEGEIIESVEKVSSSVDGLGSTIEKVEEKTTSNEKSINIISTNIDTVTGEVREVTTTTGFTFNADGMQISDGSGFVAQHTANGTYYKDGGVVTGQYTKDGSKQKDLELFGIYTYGKNNIDDTAMFIAQLFTDENGEECFGHFYNK